MKTTTPRRLYTYSVVAYFGHSMRDAIPAAWSFRATSLADAKRKARRMGHGDRQVMTDRAAQKILDAWRPR